MRTEDIQVEYIDHMGGDWSVVNAARVSFAKSVAKGAQLSEGDKNLIGFLARGMSKAEREEIIDDLQNIVGAGHADERELIESCIQRLDADTHWSPFAHTAVSIRVTAPIFAARQLVKHQVGGAWNEESRRYIDSEPIFWMPDTLHARPEGSIKQGCADESPFAEDMLEAIGSNAAGALDYYNTLLSFCIAPEEARMVLPLNTMTSWVWTGSVLFFARVCKQRAPGSHAQKAATQEVAQKIAEIVGPLYPESWRALTAGRFEIEETRA